VSAPALAESRIVAESERHIRQILNGGQFMPAFGDQLSDRQVAAMATFVRNSYGNEHGPVTEEEVAGQS
jgi:mono/diheme cytochrome c family protein